MKIRVTVGDIDIRLDGVDITHRQLRGLIRYAVGANAAVNVINAGDNEETEPKQALGFTAHIERLPEEIPAEDISWYFDE